VIYTHRLGEAGYTATGRPQIPRHSGIATLRLSTKLKSSPRNYLAVR
jgi:hypothetical protein